MWIRVCIHMRSAVFPIRICISEDLVGLFLKRGLNYRTMVGYVIKVGSFFLNAGEFTAALFSLTSSQLGRLNRNRVRH